MTFFARPARPGGSSLPRMVVVLFAAAIGVFDVAAIPPPPPRDAADLQLALDRLTVLGSILYVAPHPDDENTALLAYMARGRKVRAAYLSLTRGGGGQNLIGTEQGSLLAAVRTQELLAARRIDGAEQYFTRARDFGYSKTSAESLAIWGHEAVLGDVVWVIRRFQPDVIVTRFPSAGETHGHHTASAILALEAFHAAADPARFPEQLQWVKPWPARRIFWNAWRPPSDTRFDAAGLLQLNPGAYDPLFGESFAETAARSRSMHKTQGFGMLARRGAYTDYFKLLAGEPPVSDLFDGIDTTWARVPGGETVGELLNEAAARFNPRRPGDVLPLLLQAWEALQQLDHPWAAVKREELRDAIRDCAGLWLEAIAETDTAAPGDTVRVSVTAINRSGAPIAWASVTAAGHTQSLDAALAADRPETVQLATIIPPDAAVSQPYWLLQEPERGVYRDDDPARRGLAENPPAIEAAFRLVFGATAVDFPVPVRYRWRDAVEGERYRPFVIQPPVMIRTADRVEMCADDRPREIRFTVVAGRPGIRGTITAAVPDGWRVEPAAQAFALERKSDELSLSVWVSPPPGAGAAVLDLAAVTDGGTYRQGRMQLAYPHIPTQTVFPPAHLHLVRLDLRRDGRRIGYIMGAGDDVPDCLRQIGYTVELLSDEDLESGDLSAYPAIVAGVRAYNTRLRLSPLAGRLADYVAGGGTLVVQYATDRGLVADPVGPVPLTLTRRRVTDEASPVIFLLPEHPVLTTPNRITAADFAGWEQERGLYFAGERDPRFAAPLAMHDPGEAPLDGGLVVVRHGRGHFAYTGLAFFRQLPAGVPGAYRLFVNLLSLEAADE